MRGFSPELLGNRRNKNSQMPPPDVTFVFAEDVVEWDAYLSRQFEGTGTVIQHEQVEKMTFPLACSKASAFSDARVVLVILSPALVAFLDNRPSDGFQFTKLLKPSKTIAMLCGVTSSGLSGVRDVLIAYDDWHHLEAKDKDINMVRNVIELIHEMLTQSKESEKLNKSKFKLVPRKVQEGNGKVYVLLTKPLENSTQLRVTIEATDVREVPVKRRNPYTLVFVIPDDLMQAQNIVNVHVWCGEDLLGVSPVKCVSKMGELFSLLTSVTSPYEFLCDTLGMPALHDVDTHLTSAFKENLPKSGFDLLHKDFRQSKVKKTKEEYPTLLHFAARHGLCQLVTELLNCPSARLATSLKNARGLSPAQLANHAGHNEVVAAIDEFLKSSSLPQNNCIETVVQVSYNAESENKCSNPSDYYDVPAHPVPVLHLPANRRVGSEAPDKENEYLRMKGSHKENIQPSNTFFDSKEKQQDGDNVFTSNSAADKTKLSLLESQAKLIEIMEAYKKGSSLTEVERMHNEWKVLYQVSDLEAKSTLDGLRNLYAKAQKAKLSKKHSSSFSELRQFLNNKLRRKESIGSKGTTSRKNSKDLSTEKLFSEPDSVRPVSTLSVLSNTSSSSGSSFDRLSTASAGSDSGHHSDFGDDRNNKLKEKFDSRYNVHKRSPNAPCNISHLHKNIQCLTLASKPPPPPPRPVKPVSRYGSLEDCKHSEVPQYAVCKKMIPPSFEESFKLLDYMQPDTKSSTLSGDFRVRKSSLSAIDFPFEDPNANYDCPPPPRPSCSVTKSHMKNSSLPLPICDPKTDYDLVPPPLPVSSPPKKLDISPSIFDQNQSYDIPNPAAMNQAFQRSDSVSSNYDFPKTTLMDNTNTQAACTCQVSPSKNNLGSVKSCCVGNKLSSLKRVNNLLPSVPNSDIIFNIEKEKKDLKNTSDKKLLARTNQYYNVCLRSPKEVEISQRDSIPEEMAPPPPIIDNESPEEHYKMVGAPIPVSPFSKVS